MKDKKVRLRYLLKTLFVALVAGVISFAFTASGQKKSNSSVVKNRCSSICVYLRSTGMDPDTLTVKVGETVQFNSSDWKVHNIGIGEGYGEKSALHSEHSAKHEHIGDFESGDFKADEAWRISFKQVGTYKFHDHYNPAQNILIVVY